MSKVADKYRISQRLIILPNHPATATKPSKRLSVALQHSEQLIKVRRNNDLRTAIFLFVPGRAVRRQR